MYDGYGSNDNGRKTAEGGRDFSDAEFKGAVNPFATPLAMSKTYKAREVSSAMPTKAGLLVSYH